MVKTGKYINSLNRLIMYKIQKKLTSYITFFSIILVYCLILLSLNNRNSNNVQLNEYLECNIQSITLPSFVTNSCNQKGLINACSYSFLTGKFSESCIILQTNILVLSNILNPSDASNILAPISKIDDPSFKNRDVLQKIALVLYSKYKNQAGDNLNSNRAKSLFYSKNFN